MQIIEGKVVTWHVLPDGSLIDSLATTTMGLDCHQHTTLYLGVDIRLGSNMPEAQYDSPAILSSALRPLVLRSATNTARLTQTSNGEFESLVPNLGRFEVVLIGDIEGKKYAEVITGENISNKK